MPSAVKMFLGSDHAGFALRRALRQEAERLGAICEEFGAESAESSFNYAESAAEVSGRVCDSQLDTEEENFRRVGLLVCGSGIGVCIAANRFAGVRAALCWNAEVARLSRKHNDANILCIGARMISTDLAVEILDIFLTEKFEGGRHVQRLKFIDQLP